MIRLCLSLCTLLVFALPSAIAADAPERASTVGERVSLNVTVYNGGKALIHDRRVVPLEEGLNRIAWRDVSAQMDATSAILEPVGGDNRIGVREQNFDYDLLGPDVLLRKYVGREVTVVHEARFVGERDTRETAKILSVNGGIVLKYKDGIETGVRGHIVFPDSGGAFRERPTLVLQLESERALSQTLDLSYLTSGMTWSADYVGVVSADGSHLALTGLVTLSNTSGESYENARLQLVAGNVNVVQPNPNNGYSSLRTIAGVSSAGVSQENYYEYHLYTLARPTTVLDNETKQLTLLTAQKVPIRETLELRGSPDYYRSAEPDIGDRLPVGSYVSFESRGGELGVPLPGGIVRLYKNDSHGLSQFLGSDQIDHTPKNETVRLHVGDSFDVTARKTQSDFRQWPNCSTDSSYRIVLSNAKTTAQNVLIVEPIPGDWQIADENVAHTKSSASTASWNLRVPAAERSTLTYTAHVRWCGE
jgi:hypothetical protein